MNSPLLQRPLPGGEERAFNKISLWLESLSSTMDETLKMPLWDPQERRPGPHKEEVTPQCASAEREM